MIKTCLFCLLLLPILLHAQDHTYVDYTVKDGLANSTVYSMVQDKDGFMWFGTETGLSRFDGTHFRNFYIADGLPDNEIIKLFVDSRNRVWIIPFKNSLCYYQHGRIHNWQNDSLLGRLPIHSEVVSVIEDGSGNIAISETDCIHLIDTAGKITTIRQFDGKALLVIQAGLNEKQQFRFIIGMPGKNLLVDVDRDRLILSHRLDWRGPNNISSTFVGPYLEIQEDQDSLFFLDNLNHSSFKLPMPKGFLSISRLSDSSVSLNAWSSTMLINVRQHKIIDSFLPGQTVSCVLQDSENDLWFSTLGGGVQRLGARAALHYSFQVHSTSLPVFSIQKIDSVLYVGTERFHLFTSWNGGRDFEDRRIYDMFSRGRIMTIARVDKDRVIAGSDAGTFLITGGRSSRLLWQFGAEKALAVINDTSAIDFSGLGVFVRRLSDGVIVERKWESRSTCGCLSGDTCYVGTLNGLYAIARNKDVAFLGNRFPVLKARIAALQAADDGTLWIATYGEGLAAYKDGRLRARITTANGLTSDICRSLFMDGRNIWVGTDRGLDKITDTGTGYRLARFSSADGLPSEIINTIFVQGKKVYLGGPDGMTQFNEDDITGGSVCRLCMTGITIGGKEWPPDTTDFRLAHTDNDLLFQFSGISYRSSGTITYRYKLSGLDEQVHTTDQGTLHYPSLPPGRYELQVYAINRFGGTSNRLSLPFVIAKPWWEFLWLRILVFLASAGLVWFLFHLRVQAIRKKEIEKMITATRIAELEQMALRSQMNPHFIFNCLNSIQIYVMDKDILGANEFITNFSKLIRQTLALSARSQISLREELDYLTTYLELEKKRFEDKFTWSILLPPGLDQYSYSLPSMILQPYVENALHHGINHRNDNKGRITISVARETEYLLCIIEDNGVGRKIAAQYKSRQTQRYPSQGMEITSRRIEMLNTTRRSQITVTIEDIVDDDHEPCGTRVHIRFPV